MGTGDRRLPDAGDIPDVQADRADRGLPSSSLSLRFSIYAGGCAIPSGVPESIAEVAFGATSARLLMGGADAGLVFYLGSENSYADDPLTVADGKWLPISMNVVVSGGMATATATVGGSGFEVGQPVYSYVAGGGVSVRLGIDGTDGSQCEVDYDNVTFAWGP